MTDQSKNTTAAVAGVAGAVVGAGVAVAATKIMSDKKMRDKVKGTLTQVKNQVIEVLEQHPEIAQKGGQAHRSLKASGKSTKKQQQSKVGADQNAGSPKSSDVAM